MDNIFHIIRENLNDFVQKLNIIQVSSNIDINQYKEMCQNLEESKIIVISQINKKIHETYVSQFIIGFKNTIIFIDKSFLSFLNSFLPNNLNLTICFLQDTKEDFDHKVHIFYKEYKINAIFQNDYYRLNSYLLNSKKIKDIELKSFLKCILSCLSAFLIIESYFKSKKDRIKDFFSKPKKSISLDSNKFQFLRSIAKGSLFGVELYYSIEIEELVVFKVPCHRDIGVQKLFKREVENYLKLHHPFLPKFYGAIETSKSIVIEYIEGKTLNEIGDSLNEDEKITIIFEIILVIEFLHRNHFIYRDLKPNNVIINSYKTPVLIDFNSMILDYDIVSYTNEFPHLYAAPEICIEAPLFTYKNDIYSIGRLMYFIMNRKAPNEYKPNDFGKYKEMEQIFLKCTKVLPDERPSIIQLMIEFFVAHFQQIHVGEYFEKFEDYYKNIFDKKTLYLIQDLSLYPNHPFSQFRLAAFYANNNYIKSDINKELYYLHLSANQKCKESLKHLGFIYSKMEYGLFDINKAINFFVLASEQNDVESQFSLGLIYDLGTYVQRDLYKSVHYYLLAAKQNHPQAMLNLGVIYYNDFHDTDQSVYYLTLASDANEAQAQFLLGRIYDFDSHYHDVKKAIHYYSLAANQNHIEAMFNLSLIYYKGKYLLRDINKAIYYATLAANQSHLKAQFALGMIYYEGKYIKRDFNKSISYFKLCVNQGSPAAKYMLFRIYYNIYSQSTIDTNNDLKDVMLQYLISAADNYIKEAQYTLGILHITGNLVQKDIKKALYYLELSADQNYLEALFYLGIFYYQGKYFAKDVYRAINYLQRASEQNCPKAQNNIGFIYINDLFSTQNIGKAIHYFELAAKQNHPVALYNLGLIYYNPKYKLLNFEKAIYYFTLASDKDYYLAQYELGTIYLLGQCVEIDINKSIYYLTKAAKENHSRSQYLLGLIYILGISVHVNINKAMFYLFESSKNGNNKAKFAIGFLYHEGKLLSRDIIKAMHYYKEVSSLNDSYAKNNLGIIYKYGFENVVQKNISNAIIYFNESIKLSNDVVSMYNLAHIYIYEISDKESIDKSIELLIKSIVNGFIQAITLLCIVLIKKHGLNFGEIENEIKRFAGNSNKIVLLVFQLIVLLKLDDELILKEMFKHYGKIDYLYNYYCGHIITQNLLCNDEDSKPKLSQKNPDISNEFYKGFGIDLI